eukprot:g27053.t1
MQVLAAPEVLSRLQTYRMHELESSGLHLDQLATWTPTPEEETLQVDTQVGLLKLTSFRSRHSETCFGARLEIGELCIGWTADSGYAPRLMDALSVKCQLLIVDARKDGSAEHASFQDRDIVEYVSSRPQMDFLGVRPEESLCHVVVIGYGAQSEAPTPEDLPSSAASREMMRNIKSAEARLDALQQTQEKTAAVLNTEVSGLSDKVESLQTFAKTLAKQNDLEILEDRMQKALGLMLLPSRKAAATAMKSLSDRVTEMGMEAHTQNTRISMALDEHKGHIGALQKEASKLDRQHELERSRVSNCIVALEKAEELGIWLFGRTFEHAVRAEEYYTFGESTWDLVIFIGTGALGPLGSFQTFLLAVVNVLMQVVFVAIAAYNFTSPDVDEEAILASLRWRRSSGHSFADYSAVAKESLVHRVCKIDKSLESSGIQVALMEDINKYLKSDAAGMEGFFTGQILCIVALVCWYLMVAKEVSHALALHRGVMAMPRGLTKLDQRENPFTQVVHYRLRAVTFSRKLASGLLLLYRLVAAGLLVMVGTYFLVYTVSVTELILNAVALGIILETELRKWRHLVHQLDPLPMPSLPRIRGADAKSVFMSLAIPGLTLFVYFTMLGPMVQTLEEVKSAMCGGNVDFVWTLDKNRITRLSPTVGGGWDEEEDSIKTLSWILGWNGTRAIEEAERIGYGSSINQTRFGLWESEVSVLSDIAAMSHPELVQASNPSCGDLANQEPLLNYLRYFLQNDSIQSCADALPYCNSVTKMPEYGGDEGRGWATRYLCAESCGCRNPGGEGISLQGCPADDCRATPDFTSFRESSVCIEKNASRLRRFAPWSVYGLPVAIWLQL